MKVSEHITYGAIASAGLSHWIGWNSIYFFIGSVAIDLDHYAEFLYYQKFKNWSIRDMFKWYGYLTRFINNTEYMVLHAFHTAEFWCALLVVISYFNSMELSYVFFGMMFHVVLDRIRMHQNGFLNIRANSFFEYYLRKTSWTLQQGGVPNPEKIFWFHTDNFNRYKETK